MVDGCEPELERRPLCAKYRISFRRAWSCRMSTIGRKLLVQKYLETRPAFAAPPKFVGADAAVVGRVTVGAGAMLGVRSVIRADGHYIKIGDNLCLGDRATIHIAHELFPADLGDDVTVGENSVVHACSVGDRCYLGDNVVILDGSKVSPFCAIEDDSVVFPGSELEGGWLYGGRPAKPIRPIELAEIEAMGREARRRLGASPAPATPSDLAPAGEFQLIAATARLSGSVYGEEGASIWYSCDLEAGPHGIEVGAGANVQDNTTIRSINKAVRIGAVTTVGHNVTLVDCEIGERCLIGIGSYIAAGTVVADDVLLAAGAQTAPGQALESGWMYGGNPAKPIKRMDDGKRQLIEVSSEVYVEYARNFSQAEERYVFGDR